MFEKNAQNNVEYQKNNSLNTRGIQNRRPFVYGNKTKTRILWTTQDGLEKLVLQDKVEADQEGNHYTSNRMYVTDRERGLSVTMIVSSADKEGR